MDFGMIRTFAITTLLYASSLSQFSMDFGMKPDVRFDEDNDRFDVASIIQEQNRAFSENQEDYRRHAEEYSKGGGILDALKDTIDNMGDEDSFAYHDKMEGSDGDGEYEKNLKAFQGNRRSLNRRSLQKIVDNLHGGQKSGRRGMPPSPENVLLFHYGVPVNMEIEGYLQVPLKKR